MKKTLLLLNVILFSLLNVYGQQTYLLNASNSGQTITNCNAVLYDSGGPDGNYSSSENYNIKFCSPFAGSTLSLHLDELETESSTYDYMYIYDGNSVSENNGILVNKAGGTPAPEQGNTYTTTGQCAYITWISDVSGNYAGFTINISCNIPCQNYSINILNTNPLLTNPADIYIGTTVNFNATGNYPDNNLYYLQSDNNLTWIWTINTPSGEVVRRGTGLNSIDHTFDETGTYTISLSSEDIYGCAATMSGVWTINVSDEIILDSALSGGTITTCTGKIYDSGGLSGNYASNEDYIVYLCSNFPGSLVHLDFTDFDVLPGDYLTIYDGSGTTGTILLDQATGTNLPYPITASGECITLVWHSGNSSTANGYEAEISCISPPCQDFDIFIAATNPSLISSNIILPGTTVNFSASGSFPNINLYPQSNENITWTWSISNGGPTLQGTGMVNISHTFENEGTYTVTLAAADANGCVANSTASLTIIVASSEYIINSSSNGTTYITCGGIIYDSGGPDGDYGNSENYNITVCSPNSNNTITLDVLEFNTESSSYDWMYIYDGTDENAPILVNKAGGISIIPQINSTQECIHITWLSDASGIRSGFALAISCNTPCQDYTIDISNSVPSISSSAEINIGSQVRFTATGDYPNEDEYSQNDAILNWQWEVTTPQGTENYGGFGINTLDYGFNNAGTYTINLSSTDPNGCTATIPQEWTINVIPAYLLNEDSDGHQITTLCNGTIYDSGGEDYNYQDNEDYTVTYCSNFPGSKIRLDFTSFDLENNNDHMTIYNGTGTTGTVIMDHASGNILPPAVTSLNECLTIEFITNGSVNRAGFAANISCIPPECQDFTINIINTEPSLIACDYTVTEGRQVLFTAEGYYPNQDTYPQDDNITEWSWDFGDGETLNGTGMLSSSHIYLNPGTYTVNVTATDQNGCTATIPEPVTLTVIPEYILDSDLSGTTISTCGGTLYDSGGPDGNYGNNENYNVTICSSVPGASLTIDVAEFNTESAIYDWMYINDGTDNTSPVLVNKAGGTVIDPQILSTGECIYLIWRTDGSGIRSGFALDISCNIPCQDYTIDIISTTPVISNNSEIYINSSVSFNASGVFPDDGNIYTQNNGNLRWIWTITSPSGNVSVINGIGSDQISYIFTESGTYNISLSATDINNCTVNIPSDWQIDVLPVYIINEDSEGNTIRTICDGNIYDSGGPAGNYQNNEDYTVTYCSNLTGSVIQLEFTEFNVSSGDHISVYDGTSVSYPVVVDHLSSMALPLTVSSSGECLTIEWYSDGTDNNTGFAAGISCIAPPCQEYNIYISNTTPSIILNDYTIPEGRSIEFTASASFHNNNSPYPQSNETTMWEWIINDGVNSPVIVRGMGLTTINHTFPAAGTYTINLTTTDVNECVANIETITLEVISGFILDSTLSGTTLTTCGGILYDSGGANGDYGNSEDYNVTICSSMENSTIIINFLEFETESASYDWMYIYDGIDNTAPVLVNKAGGTVIPQNIESSGECVYITWSSDGSSVRSGFALDISCNIQCQEVAIGNIITDPPYYTTEDIKYIDICQGDEIFFTATGNYPGNNTGYSQSDETSSFQWDFGNGTTAEGVSVSRIFPDGNGYEVDLTITDTRGCVNSDQLNLRIRVSPDPDFTGTTISPASECAGYEIYLNGSVVPGQGSFGSSWNYNQNIVSSSWSGNNITNPDNPGTAVPDTSGVINYIFEITDDFGCSYQTTIPYTVTSVTVPSFTQPGPYCLNQIPNDLPLISSEGITGTWYPSTINTSLEGITTYTFTPDNQYCTSSVNMQVVVYPLPAATINNITGSDVINCTYSNIIMEATGGSNYIWNNGSISHQNIAYSPGNYMVTVTDSNGCSEIASHSITIDTVSPVAGITNNTGVTILNCNISTISLTATGGTSYIWSNGVTSPNNLVNTHGLYSVTVTLDNGCYDTDMISITQSDELPTITISTNPLTTTLDCNISNITMTASGAVHYLWSTGHTTPSCNITQPGTYTVTGTDNFGCSNYASITINQDLTVPDITIINNTGAVALNCSTSEINLTVTGGISYMWNDGTVSSSKVITSPGTYYVTATGNNGCLNEASIDISEDFSLPPAAIINNTGTTVLDCNNPVINLTATGGGTYEWSNNQNTVTNIINSPGVYFVTVTGPNGCSDIKSINITQDTTPPVIMINTNTATTILDCNTREISLVASGGVSYRWVNGTLSNINPVSIPGIYTVTVTAANGCSGSEQITITQDITPPAVTITNHTGTTVLDCNNSSVNVTAGGGVSYIWSNMVATADNSITVPGTYTVEVTGSNGCINSSGITITMPDEMVLNISETEILCYGQTSTVTVDVTGGTAPYSGTGVFNNIPAGYHSYTVTDANGCETSASITITQPEMLSVDINILNEISCYESADGEITAIVTGGTGTYSFNWNNSDSGTENPGQVSGGMWIVEVSDSHNCISIDSIIITQPDSLFLDLTVRDISCHGSNDGQVIINSVTGGTAPYYFEVNGLHRDFPAIMPAGTHNVRLYDSNNCELVKTVSIVEPEECILSLQSNLIQCGVSGGSITCSVSGGNAPYSYHWSTGDTTEILTNVPSGVYTLDITDSNGCTSSQTTRLSSFGNITVSVSEVNPVSCYGLSDGVVSLFCPNAYGNISILWSNSETTPTVSGLEAGLYTVTVSDSWGCSGTGSIAVSQPTALTVTPTVSHVKCYGDLTGSIELDITGGQTPHTISWSNASTGKKITGLSAGIYSSIITDRNNCSQTLEFEVSQPEVLELNYNLKDVSCYGNYNGAVEITGYGGTKPYNYSVINSINMIEQKNHKMLRAGQYTIVVEDKNGCKITEDIVISQPEIINATYTANNPSCNGNNDGYIDIRVSGGMGPYIYRLNNTEYYDLQTITNLKHGLYSLEIIDANSCSLKINNIRLTEANKDCLTIPNAFTPNGDGINDLWIIEGIELYPQATIRIFNKWGQELFSAKGNEGPWDGKYNSNPVPAGTYVYIIQHHDNEKEYHGTVTVVY